LVDLNREHKEYNVGGKKLLFFEDETKAKNTAARFTDNNLLLCDENYDELWNMGEVCGKRCGRADAAVSVYIINENEFGFYTFGGWRYVIDARSLSVLESVFNRF